VTVSDGAPRGSRAVALVIVSLACAGGALWANLAGRPPLVPGLGLPFLAVVAAYGLSEALVLHVQFRREHHTIILSEAPVVLALLALPPGLAVLARLLAGLLPAVGRVGRHPVKLSFNMSLLMFEVALAGSLLHALPLGGAPRSVLWGATAGSVLLAVGVGYLATSAVIGRASGSPVARPMTAGPAGARWPRSSPAPSPSGWRWRR